jgi:hypothetical protein
VRAWRDDSVDLVERIVPRVEEYLGGLVVVPSHFLSLFETRRTIGIIGVIGIG